MDNQLREYKRISNRRNYNFLKKQIKYTFLVLFGSVLGAHLITFLLIYFVL